MTQLPRMFETIFKENFTYLTNIDEADRPLLAHYTSLETLEKIIKNESFLASHPFVMNDTQELIFGLTIAKQILEEFKCDKKIIKMMGEKNNLTEICDEIYRNFDDFSNKYLNSTFVLSFSEHDEIQNPDGRLSMWRGYGADGQGAALIFCSKTFENNLSDFEFAKVKYGTDHTRKKLLRKFYKKIFAEFAPIKYRRSSIIIA